jgi:hypothetical protein
MKTLDRNVETADSIWVKHEEIFFQTMRDLKNIPEIKNVIEFGTIVEFMKEDENTFQSQDFRETILVTQSNDIHDDEKSSFIHRILLYIIEVKKILNYKLAKIYVNRIVIKDKTGNFWMIPKPKNAKSKPNLKDKDAVSVTNVVKLTERIGQERSRLPPENNELFQTVLSKVRSSTLHYNNTYNTEIDLRINKKDLIQQLANDALSAWHAQRITNSRPFFATLGVFPARYGQAANSVFFIRSNSNTISSDNIKLFLLFNPDIFGVDIIIDDDLKVDPVYGR